MKPYIPLCAIIVMSALSLNAAEPTTTPAPKENRLFEMRTYFAAPGKLDALCARFRNHTLKLFEKHGMTNIGYWIPTENPDNKLVYMLAYPDKDARDKAWKEFGADPDWKAAQKESEKDGKLVAKSDSVFLKATDFSPEVKPTAAGEPRAFELRVYQAAQDKLPNLLSRFRDHTVTLFAKHGMTQIGYWTPVDKDKGADDTLVYMLAHKSKEAADTSFKNFRADPDWVAAKKASEDKAGGSLTVQDGVKSTFMAPTDFSPMK
ncbi:MAG: NIPSNAP family protein [Candidatus Sumerlaeota bacterium]|nr:NIPSNAP family protein [Candidatus Sumerlaeota bacterium]